jgi:alanine-glyoxylate transaminase/serine-glyoxylate transaminase/serine-pyruvate transaminase
MNLLLGYWGATTRTYHHTAPTNSLFALHEALLLIKEEGLDNAWARHRRHHIALKAGLEAMGLRFFVEESAQLPQMNAVLCPAGVDEEAVRKTLLSEFSIDGAGLGPLKGRLALPWASCRRTTRCSLSALGSVLMDMGLPIRWRSQAAAHQAYATLHAADAHPRARSPWVSDRTRL